MIPDLNDARWRASSFSGSEGGQCVQLHPDGAVRDSKNPDAVLPVDLTSLVKAVATRAWGRR